MKHWEFWIDVGGTFTDVLAPIRIELPHCLLNPQAHDDPAKCAAMAGGNVETSMRIVDAILGALGLAAASQGTMNNLMFGDASFGYYETICGGSGAGRNLLIRADGATQELPAKIQLQVSPGDRICIETPGGGGYGRLSLSEADSVS